MTDTPTHECRRGPKCAARVKRDNELHGQGVERPNTLCKPCEDHAFASIRALHDDWCTLRTLMTAGPTGNGITIGSGGSNRPIPIPVGVDALMTAIETETLRWARIVAPDTDIPTSPGAGVRRCVTILASRTGTLVDLPAREVTEWVPHPDGGDTTTRVVRDGVDAVLRLARLHQRAIAIIGTSERRIWLPDPCPHCGIRALSPSRDQERISCQACRITWAVQQFEFLGSVLDYGRKQLKGETA